MKRIYLLFVLGLINASALKAQCTATTVPYFQSFENIPSNNALPACWAASSGGTVCLTYTSPATQNRLPYSGTKFASFYAVPTGTNYFYSEAILLYTGVTYSSSLKYIGDAAQSTNWSDLSIMRGTSQAPTGLVTIASTGGPAVAATHNTLSNTFSVAASGLYYIAVRAISSSTCCASYLSWDDLIVTAPCSLNAPNLSLTASSNTLCAGQSVTLTASGADTYSWGSNTFVITPGSNTVVNVIGTATASGCVSTKSINLQVMPVPQLMVTANKSSICKGDTAKIFIQTNPTPALVVSPSVTTTYTFSQTYSSGCTATAGIQIGVNPIPIIGAVASSSVICAGEPFNVNVSGAQTYSIVADSTYYFSGSTFSFFPKTGGTYTLTGKDNNGCTNTSTLNLLVNTCTSIEDHFFNRGITVFPNPVKDQVTISANGNDILLVTIFDHAGREVYCAKQIVNSPSIDVTNLCAGIYLVKVNTTNGAFTVKILRE